MTWNNVCQTLPGILKFQYESTHHNLLFFFCITHSNEVSLYLFSPPSSSFFLIVTSHNQMYQQPQPQSQPNAPFTITNLQTTTLYSHSSNPFLLSFPHPPLPLSESSLHPPGADPHAHSSLYLSASPSYGHPLSYEPSVGSSNETSVVPASLHTAWNDTWSHQFVAYDATAMLPNQTKVTKPMRCEVCKIDCNSRDVYEKHISGKKHKRNLQVLTYPTSAMLMSSIQGQVLTGGAVGQELESSKQQKLLNGGAAIDSVKVCTVCNVVCNSQDVFNKHLAGKKHAAQVSLMCNNGIGPYLAAFKRNGIGPWKKIPKKIKVAQSAWCEVCKISCNSKDVYIVHLSGKKHLKNLEKMSKSRHDAGATAAIATANTLQHATNPIIGPQEKSDTDKRKSQKAPEKDIEAKKRKVVEGGAAAAAVRLCTLCNVVCNSQTVFNAHLTGQKHAAMVKKQADSGGASTG